MAILIVLLNRPSTGEPAEMQFHAGWLFMGLISLAAGLVSLALGGKAHGESCGE